MLDGRKRYTQDHGHFPNLFLNDCIVLKDPKFERAHQTHLHSYWLKYLILKLIVSRGESITCCSDILEVFCETGEYKEELVRHVIGSLCTSNEFRCADVDYTIDVRNYEARRIVATSRGRGLVSDDWHIHSDISLKSEFCFSFLYLQLVVNDYLMCLPVQFAKTIFEGPDYAYLYFRDSEYGETVSRVVKTRARSCLTFMFVIRAALNAELARKPKLKQYLISKNLIPNVDRVIEALYNELLYLADAIGVSSIKDEAVGVMHKMGTDTELDEFFNKYYESGNIFIE
jgi:hypothetical protein